MFSSSAILKSGKGIERDAVPRGPVSESVRTRAELDRLFLIVESLWMLLKEKHGYSDDELTAKIIDLDLSSGTLDNRRPTKEVGNCKKCQRRLMRNKKYCVYCGEIHLSGPFE
jgi:hypothetical protein